jgi:hypothetical protein
MTGGRIGFLGGSLGKPRFGEAEAQARFSILSLIG